MKFAKPSRQMILWTASVFGGFALLLGGGFSTLWYAYPLPSGMLHAGPPGTLALDKVGGTLLDITGNDEQRRLPISIGDAGNWIPLAVIAAEDQEYLTHCGIDIPAMGRAVWQNIRMGRVVRGASTITMQVAGMKLNHPRTYSGKSVEAFRALQIEAKYTKDEILEAWLNMASFGANLVGVETASRAWYGKPAKYCSLSESALLAALPNSPARLRPDRYPEAAVARRNQILDRMLQSNFITPEQHQEALQEIILISPALNCTNDVHVGWMALGRGGGASLLQTTIDPEAQSIAHSIVKQHAQMLPDHLDIALVLVDLETSGIAALIGSSDFADPRDGQVNGTTAKRSPGSALKPFVYAAAFEAGRLSPETVVDDAPLDLGGWRPKNIDRVYFGQMSAAEALRQSRNTPALRIARDLGLPSVVSMLRRCGIAIPLEHERTIGLASVVGGVEVPLVDLVGGYATLARGGVQMPVRLLADEPQIRRRVLSERTCTAIELCLAGSTNDAALALPFLAAKTGTSSGHRDAVAAGWNRKWAAVVWVGRFDDGGDPLLLGADAALPILQELLHHPMLATLRTSQTYKPWQVHHPVGQKHERVPAILEPRDGEVLYALDKAIDLTPQIRSHGSDAVLFLNGAPVDATMLRLLPGEYEFRLVEMGRPPHAVNFTVNKVGS
jgi:penicillin-binding protein 1C